ncbi:MAG: DUF742 domain-containing protein [Corynebacteriales bacterium]|nr:DUF742 domain-containing protein [Mycobacteriales bacterium]
MNYDDQPGASSGPLVRPYAMTGGRTRPRIELAMEALVTTNTRVNWDTASVSHDWYRIVELCRSVQSIAEIGAYLSVPLGVARVIVGDMAEAGIVEIHEPGHIDDQIGTYLLERVLSGLRKL